MFDAKAFSVAMFESSDRKDVAGWTANMTDDVRFVFGNGEPLIGKEAVSATITAFFGAIEAIKHTVLDSWILDDKLTQKLTVTYTRLDGSVLEAPAANILTMRDGLISEYLIYVDNSELFK